MNRVLHIEPKGLTMGSVHFDEWTLFFTAQIDPLLGRFRQWQTLSANSLSFGDS